MAENLQIRKTASVLDTIREVEERIRQRAHELFLRDGLFGKDLDNWLLAEKELTWRPAIELSEKDNEFLVKVSVPGVDPKAIDIEVTPEEIVVKASTKEEREERKGDVHTSEIRTGDVFRAIRLPKRIDPEKVKAEAKNGMVTLTAAIAEGAQARKVRIEAA
jgi:HSP20 family protein